MTSSTTTAGQAKSIYLYSPSHVFPAVFAALIGMSLVLHIYQTFRYNFWRITFFICWGGAVFLTGWIVRCFSSHEPADLSLYIAQTIFIYGGPPIYSAAAYNVLGRLLHYLPMHAALNPNRVVYFFVYLGIAVESLTGAGAGRMSAAGSDLSIYQSGGTLIAIATVLQAVIESLLMVMVGVLHHRCARAHMLTRNVHMLCITLYGTSTLILLRCVFRAVEAFSMFSSISCLGSCGTILSHEWYIYAFEAAPMVLFTYWLNFLHPGRYLPREKNRYLDLDGKTERLGPGWIDRRPKWKTFADPFDLVGVIRGQPEHDRYWLRPENWPACEDGSFACGSASNVARGAKMTSESASTPLTTPV